MENKRNSQNPKGDENNDDIFIDEIRQCEEMLKAELLKGGEDVEGSASILDEFIMSNAIFDKKKKSSVMTDGIKDIKEERLKETIETRIIKILPCLHMNNQEINICYDQADNTHLLLSNSSLVGMNIYLSNSYIKDFKKTVEDSINKSNLYLIDTFDKLKTQFIGNIIQLNNMKYDSLWKYNNWSMLFSNLKSSANMHFTKGLNDNNEVVAGNISLGSGISLLSQYVYTKEYYDLNNKEINKLITNKENKSKINKENDLKQSIITAFNSNITLNSAIKEVEYKNKMNFNNSPQGFKNYNYNNFAFTSDSNSSSKGINYFGESIKYFSTKIDSNGEYSPFIINDIRRVFLFEITPDFSTLELILNMNNIIKLKLLYYWISNFNMSFFINRHSLDYNKGLDLISKLRDMLILNMKSDNVLVKQYSIKLFLLGFDIFNNTSEKQVESFIFLFNISNDTQTNYGYVNIDDELSLDNNKIIDIRCILINKMNQIMSSCINNNFNRITLLNVYYLHYNKESNDLIIKQRNVNISQKYAIFPIWWIIIPNSKLFQMLINSLNHANKYCSHHNCSIDNVRINDSDTLEEMIVKKEVLFNINTVKLNETDYVEEPVTVNKYDYLSQDSERLVKTTNHSSYNISIFSDSKYSIINAVIGNKDIELINKSLFEVLRSNDKSLLYFLLNKFFTSFLSDIQEINLTLNYTRNNNNTINNLSIELFFYYMDSLLLDDNKDNNYIEFTNNLLLSANRILQIKDLSLTTYSKIMSYVDRLNIEYNNKSNFITEESKTFDFVLNDGEPLNINETVNFSHLPNILSVAVDVNILCNQDDRIPYIELNIVSDQHNYTYARTEPSNNCLSFGTAFSIKLNNMLDYNYNRYDEGYLSDANLFNISKSISSTTNKRLFLPGKEIKINTNSSLSSNFGTDLTKGKATSQGKQKNKKKKANYQSHY